METYKENNDDLEVIEIEDNIMCRSEPPTEGSIIVDEGLSIYSGLDLGKKVNYKLFQFGEIIISFANKPNKLTIAPSLFYLYDDGTYRHYIEWYSQVQGVDGPNYNIFFLFRFETADGVVLANSSRPLRNYKCGAGAIQFNANYDVSVYNETQRISIQFSGSALMCRI